MKKKLLSLAILFSFGTIAYAAPYCIPTSTNGTTGGDFINGVTLGTINNQNTGSLTGSTYNDYSTQTTQLSQAGTFALTITGGNFATEFYGAWIDYNGDSTFTANEKLGQVQSTTAGQIVTINFTVPLATTIGNKRLRIRSARNTNNMDPCTNYTRGETEDYTVQIIAGGGSGPIAYFGAVQASITLGNTVDFVDSSSFTPTSWLWSFAGGTPATSSAQNPTGISYSAVGCYAVTLTATNANGSNVLTRTCYVIVNPANPYCNTLYSTGCSGTNNINAVNITNTTLNNSGTGCNSLSGTAYSIFPTSGNTTATLYRGQAYQLNVTSSSTNSSIAAWIDYNMNNVFDSTEYISVASPATQNLAASVIINIPASTTMGNVRIRIRTRANTGGPGGSAITSTQACNSFTGGETEDYELTITDAPPVAPTANFTADSLTITAGQNVDFTDLSNGLPTSWTWTFTGAATTTSSLQNPQNIVYNTPGCYDVILTATNAQGSNTKTQICYITVLAPTYCANIHQNNCSAADFISAVSIPTTGLINDSTVCDAQNGNGYTIWPAIGDKTGSVFRTGSYSINVTVNANRIIGMWIDYDHSTSFEASEFILISSNAAANATSSANFTIPNSALLGNTMMRVRSRNVTGTLTATDACTLFGSGETEDYTITILAPPTIPPVAAFTADSLTVGIGQNVDFTDLSTNLPTGWFWTFTGGVPSSSSLQNPQNIVYNTVGCYPVQLVAFNSYGLDTIVATCYINVIIPPYCSNIHTNNCTAADNINSVTIANTSINNLNTGCNGTTNSLAYNIFPPSATTTDTLLAATTYQISVTTTAARRISCWIDYNQNGTFDANEYTAITAASVANIASTANLTIPSTALLGTTKLRIRSRSTAGTMTSADACTQFGSGETEDYTITIDAAPTLPPVSAFTADSLTITLGQNVDFADVSTNVPTTWSWSFPGGVPSSSSLQNPQNIVYNSTGCYPVTLITSNAYGTDTTTVNCYITVNTPPYCANVQTNNCGGFGGGGGSINTVAIASTNFSNANTGCTGTPYTIYAPAANTTATLNRGTTYNFSVTATATSRIAIWIDLNQNYLFDATEYFLVANSVPANIPATIAITIPSNAAIGQVGMRVRLTNTATTLGAANACTSNGNGETEDYKITIGAGGNNPPATDFNANFTSISPFGSINFSDNSSNTPTSWMWYFPGGSPSTSTAQNPTGIIYSSPGCYDVSLVSTNAFGSDSVTKPCFINVTSAASFCIPTHTNACTNSYINTVQITGTTLNNALTGCNNVTAQGYTIWPASGNTTAQLNRSQSYNLKVTCNIGSRISVWIDYNHNNIFETSEWTQVATGSQANTASTVSIFVPANAVAGPTGMRIRSITTPAGGGGGGGAVNAAANSCTTFATGESEDYTVTIFDPTLIPVANFNATSSTTICVGGSVSFADLSTNTPNVWNWTLPGTVTGSSTLKNPTVVYNTAGVFPVTLYAANGNGSDTITQTSYVTVNVGPNINAGANTSVCSGLSAQLNASGANNYSWSPSAGLSNTTIGNPIATPSVTTAYIVSATGNGCISHDTVVVTVNPFPVSVLNNLPPISQCDGTITLDAGNAGSSYLWNDSSVSTSQTITVSTSQIYSVITTNSFGCSITDSRNVEINSTPVVNLGNPVTQCGGSVNLNAGNSGSAFLWSNGATTQSILATSTNTYSVVVNNNGCTASGSVLITINSAAVSTGLGTTICAGTTAQLTANGTGTFSWTPSASLSNANVSNPIAAPSTTTLYTVTITNNGCTATATQLVTINPVNNNSSAGNNVSICRNASTQLLATGGTSYLWSPSSGLSNPNISNPIATPNSTTTYSVIVTNGSCSATKNVTVTLIGANATAGLDITVCPNNTAQLNASGGTSYSWSPATNLSATNIANPIFTAGTNSTYLVDISNGQCTYTDTVNVNVGVVTANAGNDTSICNGGNIQLVANGGVNYTWTPSTGLDNASIANPVANPTITTTYTVISSSGTCSATDSITVFVIPAVTANAGSDANLCLGSSTTLNASGGTSYSWTPSTGLSNSNIANPIANPGTNTTYFVTVSNGVCSSTDTINVQIQTLSVSINSDTTSFCAGGMAQLNATASGVSTFSWSPSAGLNDSTIANPMAMPLSTTTYTVTANDGVCIVTNNITLNVNTILTPIITTNGLTTVCEPATVSLACSSNGVSFNWNTQPSSSASSVSIAQTGCYSVTISDINGCTATSLPTCITINPIPATPVITVANDGSLNASTVASTYVWSYEGSTITESTQSFIPSNNGLYAVMAISAAGCASDTSASFNYIYTNVTTKGTQEYILVYPNPVSDNLVIRANFETPSTITITLKDIAGRTINLIEGNSNSSFVNTNINMSDLSNGIYFVNFSNGAKTWSKKIVKQ